jgi:molecular chaperone GrpE
MQDKYLRLSAEFDNYRKRTLKEKIELTKTAGESILVNILPVMDDFERAVKMVENAPDSKAMKEGIDLIYNKLRDFLKQNGIKEIESDNREFDTDLHEAVTSIPAPEKKMKGKVVDTIQKGYYLHDKVIRFSKVVIGE